MYPSRKAPAEVKSAVTTSRLHMRRNLAWGLFAFYPLIACLLAFNLPPEWLVTDGDPSPFLQFLLKYWYLVLGTTFLFQFAFFIVHAATRGKRLKWQRSLWILAFVLNGFLATPLYWWLYGEQ